MISHAHNRVAVTGLGIITAIGESLPEFEEGIFKGQCGIAPISLFDTDGFICQSAGQVKTSDLGQGFTARELKRVSRCDMLGLIAARQALSDAKIPLELFDKSRIGVVLGGATGGMLAWEKYRQALWRGQSGCYPSLLLPFSNCTLTDLIAGTYHFAGLRSTISTACSSSATSIGYGYDLIRSGTQDVVLTGGSEALSQLTFAGFNSIRALDPKTCRPFDKNRQGMSLGEGAAILVLENFDQAVSRGAHIYAQVQGYAINADAYHMTSPDPQGMGMSKVMAGALQKAAVSADQIDYINAHGTATVINDQLEAMAIRRVFEKARVGDLAVSSTKSMVGHCLGAAGGIEAVATILALYRQQVPPTANFTDLDPACDLDCVPNTARHQPVRFAVSNSFAFGGNNTSLVFGRVGE